MTVSRRRFVVLSAAGLMAACAPQPPATQKPADSTPAKPAEAQKPSEASKPAAAAPPAPAAPAAPATAAPLPKVAEKPAAAKPSQYKEAPMLADLVKAGKLPPIDQRLPDEPLVVKPTNVIGKYGGTLRGAALGPEVNSDLQMIMNTGMFSFNHDLSEVTPVVATSYEMAPDDKSVTIKLRKGIKWSDGAPFTADDIVFYVEDVIYNKELYPSPPGEWRSGGQPVKITKIDDFTVKFESTVPMPAFPLLQYSGPPSTPWRPKHYLSKIHPKYNPNAEADAKAAGFNSWVARFQRSANPNSPTGLNYGAQDPDMPVLDAWRPTRVDTQGQEYERNPYYFKVDPEGNQLPYTDKVVIEYVQNLEALTLKAISGQLSVAGRDLLIQSYPTIKQNEKQGDYTLRLVYNEQGADVALAFNQIHPDPALKEIFTNVKFRQAMSSAIDREEINELVFLGQGTPRQATINSSAKFYKEEWGNHFAKYDLPLANKLLDEIGLDKKGADGIRLRPDGKPLTFQLEYLPQQGPKKEVCELVVKHWAKAGVQCDAQARERAFLLQRVQSGQHDASGWLIDRTLERTAYTYGWSGSKLGPGGNSALVFAQGWTDWISSNGQRGTEPPEEAKKLAAAWNKWQQTRIGTPEYTAAAIEVHEIVKDVLWVIGTIGQGPQPAIVKNNLENVFGPNDPEKIWWGAANWSWHPRRGEQWFFKA